MRPLVVYYSLSGNTEFIARTAANLLGADILELIPEKKYPTGRVSRYTAGRSALRHDEPRLEPYDHDISGYDTIIIGTPVWASNPAPPVNTFISENDLSGKKLAFFASSLSGKGGKCLEELKKKTGAADALTLDLKQPDMEDLSGFMDRTADFVSRIIGPYDTDEEWDVFDEDGRILEMKWKRGRHLPRGMYHKIVSAWIMNSRGEYLMSKRSARKLVSPGTWECTGGAVMTGETTLDAAVREIREELGIDIDPAKGRLVRSTRHEEMREFYDVWMFGEDIDTDDLTLQTEEVSDVRWMTKDGIDRLWRDRELNMLLYYYDEIL